MLFTKSEARGSTTLSGTVMPPLIPDLSKSMTKLSFKEPSKRDLTMRATLLATAHGHREITSDHVVKAYPPLLSRYGGQDIIVLPMEYASEGNLRSWLDAHLDAKERMSTGLELFLDVL